MTFWGWGRRDKHVLGAVSAVHSVKHDNSSAFWKYLPIIALQVLSKACMHHHIMIIQSFIPCLDPEVHIQCASSSCAATRTYIWLCN